jgi:hypothetical protein
MPRKAPARMPRQVNKSAGHGKKKKSGFSGVEGVDWKYVNGKRVRIYHYKKGRG